jgi:hypothetical protein
VSRLALIAFAVSATTNLFVIVCRTLNPELEYLNRVPQALFLFIDLDNALPHQPLFTLGLFELTICGVDELIIALSRAYRHLFTLESLCAASLATATS